MSDYLDAREMAIIWSEDDKGKITDVMISYPSYILPSDGKYSNSSGVANLGWMGGDDPRLTPEGVFAGMLVDGFASQYWLEQAISQFATLEQCGWARTMMAALKKFR